MRPPDGNKKPAGGGVNHNFKCGFKCWYLLGINCLFTWLHFSSLCCFVGTFHFCLQLPLSTTAKGLLMWGPTGGGVQHNCTKCVLYEGLMLFYVCYQLLVCLLEFFSMVSQLCCFAEEEMGKNGPKPAVYYYLAAALLIHDMYQLLVLPTTKKADKRDDGY